MLIQLLLMSLIAHAQADAPSASDWPRKFSTEGKEFTVFQPQVESWQGTNLNERAAVSVSSASSSEPTYGVIWIQARTDVDKSERAVALNDISITKLNFPTARDQEGAYKKILEKNAQAVLGTISLDRLRASMVINASEAKHKVDGLKNDPPAISYSDKPAILVLVDGPAVMRPTGITNLVRIVNTRALIILNKDDGRYNLNVADRWYQASELNGAWSVASPTGSLLNNLNMIKHENAENLEAFDKAPDDVAIYLATTPTELIQTKGPLQMEPITGTQLLYVTNTPDNIFMNTSDQKYFVTLSGRWFTSKSMKGPWKFVESDRLPKDFAKIPETHQKGEILASVAGTADAQEAAIANEIPQTATVDRKTAKLEVVYDGVPSFASISGSPLQYASNSKTPVIRINQNSYYAVENGVWFSATTPNGPWTVATEVPSSIYNIPPSAPVYYVTYAYVYGASPQYVYVGYLPGYLGSYVSPSGVVVYGTGYYYHPWVSRVWYGYPATYGFGFAWGFGFGWAFRPVFYGAPLYRPWWGPWPQYWAHHGPYGYASLTVNHINVYRTWDHSVVAQRSTPASRINVNRAAVPRNNFYADSKGQVFHHEANEGWHPAPGHTNAKINSSVTQDLDRERAARERGAIRTARYRPVAPSPAVKKRRR